jgi:D-alanyl-D-alanine carboxypeptidase
MTKTHMKVALALLAVAAAAPAASASAAPHPSAPRAAKLQRALDQVVAAGVPGAVLLVRERDRTIRLTSGQGTVKPTTPMRARDRFRVGSITKTFVATVALQLVAENRLALEDSVERWLPGVVPNGVHITIRQLLNHTSGLADYGIDRGFVTKAFRDPVRVWAPRELVAIAATHKAQFPPGTGWAYSNTDYLVLGLIVEAATGRSLGSELQRRIFAPLRLRATALPSAPHIAGRHARGYFARPLEDVTLVSPSIVGAAGALVSNADDLSRFLRSLLGGRLLPPGLIEAMETTVNASAEFSYGLGLQRLPARCGALWGHTGGMPGYSTSALASKDGKRQVIVLVNATESLSSAHNGFRSFNAPERARRAIDRLIQTAHCR